MATATPSPSGIQLGFLSILQEPIGTLGGYLVTNSWGRPLEFRLSSAVQPNRVQQILYGESLPSFLCGELIGKTLIEKSATPVQLVVTDHPHALDVRQRLDLPVCYFTTRDVSPELNLLSAAKNLFVHPSAPQDLPLFQEMVEKLRNFDFCEPFARIREAIAEARRMGVTQRPVAAAA